MKAPLSESKKELMAAMHVDRPGWIGDGSLEGEIAGSLWSRLSKGLQKDHNGRIQASSSTAVLQEWLLRGGNARALTYAVWCEILLRTIKASSDASLLRPRASREEGDDEMTDDDVSDWRSTARDDMSSQGTRKNPLHRQRSLEAGALTSEEFEEIALESLRWLHTAWTEYPLDQADQEPDRLRVFAVLKCLGQGLLGDEARDAFRTVMDLCPLPCLVKLAFADVRGRFLGRIVGHNELVDGDLDVFEKAQAKNGVVSVLQLDRYADVRAGRLEQKRRKARNIIPLATAAEQSLRRVDTFPFRTPDPLEVALLHAHVAGNKERGQTYILLSNRLSQGHARASAGLEDGLLVMEWVLDFWERMLPVCKPDAVVARSICYAIHGLKGAIDTTECREGAEHLIRSLASNERLLADCAGVPERDCLTLDGRPLSEFEKLNAKYMDSTLTRINSLPSFLVKALQLSELDAASSDGPKLSEQEELEAADCCEEATVEQAHEIQSSREYNQGRISSDSESEERTLDTCYEDIGRVRKGRARTGDGFVLVSEESLVAANCASDAPSSPPAWKIRKEGSLLGHVPLDRTDSELERAWKCTVQIDASTWEAKSMVGLKVKIRRNTALIEREYLANTMSPSARAMRGRGIAKRSPKKAAYLTAAALRGIIKSTEVSPLPELIGGSIDGQILGHGNREEIVSKAFELATDRRAMGQIADEMEEDPVTPSFFAERRRGAAIAARLPRSGLRKDWVALKLVKERARAAAFARAQLAKSQKAKTQKRADLDALKQDRIDATEQGMSFSRSEIQPGDWEPASEDSDCPGSSACSNGSKHRPKRVTWAENCFDSEASEDEGMGPAIIFMQAGESQESVCA